MPPLIPPKAALGLPPGRQVGPEELLEDEQGGPPPEGGGGLNLSKSTTPDRPVPPDAPTGYSWFWLPIESGGIPTGFYDWKLIVARSKFVSEWFQTDGSRWGMTADGTVEQIQEAPAPGEVEPRVVTHEVRNDDGSIDFQAFTVTPEEGLVPAGEPRRVAEPDPSGGGALTEFQSGQLELSREKFEFTQEQAGVAAGERAETRGLAQERFGLEQQRFQATEADRARQAQIQAQVLAQNPLNVPLFTAIAAQQQPRFSGGVLGAKLGQPLPGLGGETIGQFPGQRDPFAPTAFATGTLTAQKLRAGGVIPTAASTGVTQAAFFRAPPGQFFNIRTPDGGTAKVTTVTAGSPEFQQLLAQGLKPTVPALTVEQVEALRLPSSREFRGLSPEAQQAKVDVFRGFGFPVQTAADLVGRIQREEARQESLEPTIRPIPGAAVRSEEARRKQREAERGRFSAAAARARGTQRFR